MSSWAEHREEERAKTAEQRKQSCPVCSKVIGEGSLSVRHGVPFHSECTSWRVSRQVRACVSCGFRRQVEVRFDPVEKRERFSPHCTACALEARSEHYRREAKRFALKASEARVKQAIRRSAELVKAERSGAK